MNSISFVMAQTAKREAKAKTLILRIGTLNNRGFTLIELTVVMALIGLMLSITVPAIRDEVLTDSLKKTVNHLINTNAELRNNALREQVDYLLHIDIDNGLFYTYTEDMTPEGKDEQKKRAYCLSPGIKLKDLYRFGGEKITDGEVTIRFFKGGYVQPTVLHLSEDDRSFTLVFEPFFHRVKIYDRYIEIEKEGS
ncbi:MAG: prepilin-type N-terminal cleavage/methylation domain-containing protein [Syntrophales bacterium]|nr:prepilin-type N-terminal cleavage/methylation domain-containing protein [Syntrophales bacterium]